MSDNKLLLLLDAHALIHRAYHAIQTELLSPQGEPTKAVYGFASTLLKALKDIQPTYIAAAFDVGKSFRADEFAAYKATRPKLAEDLAPQIARVRELCQAFGIPVYAQEGFEADDLIGALAQQACARGVETIIFTGDTDTFQLIDPHTRVLMVIRLGEPVLYDEARIKERYGLAPRQLIDLKALLGDPSDNIPKVRGIGEDTAPRLLQQYGSVEGILEHLDDLKPKVRESLVESMPQVRLNKKLVTIDRHAPAQLDLDAARFSRYDRNAVVALFRELGFQSLLARVPEPEAAAAPPRVEETPAQQSPENYHTVTTERDLDALVKRIKSLKAFVVDVETTTLDALQAELVGLAIGLGDGQAYYIPLGHGVKPAPTAAPTHSAKEKPQLALFEQNSETIAVQSLAQSVSQLPSALVLQELEPIFADAKIQKIAHNAKYDLIVLHQAGIEVKGLAFDTLIAAHLLEPSGQKLGLKELVFAKFGVEMTEIEALIGKGKGQLSMSQVAVERVARYACADADYTYRLYQLYRPGLGERGHERLFYELEMPLVPVIVELERAGVLLDLPALNALSEKISARLSDLEAQIYALVGAPFNLGSPAQLSDALFVKLGLSSTGLERTRTGQISTAAGVLDGLKDAHPVIALILEHRELSKLKGTYVDALPQLVNPKDGRVHTSFNQTGTVTGRLSSSNPNLQNIPIRTELGRQVRRAFIAPPGKVLLSADYSQVELRILAHVSQDPNMLQAFAEGEDIHAATAATLFNVPLEQVTPQQRRHGKTINFGVVYGISDWGIADRTELSLEDSRQLILNYWLKYPRVKEYIERTKEQARTRGYVESLMGRRRYFPELARGQRISPALRGQAEREAINMPIQATAADIIKLAMVNLARALDARGLKSEMILQVHDELLLECPQVEDPARAEIDTVAPLVRRVMEEAYHLDAPLKADVKVGPNWDQMKPVEM